MIYIVQCFATVSSVRLIAHFSFQHLHIDLVCILMLPLVTMGQILFPHPGQYGSPVGNDIYQQQQLPMHQQQLPMHQQQQSQMNQQPQINQLPQMNQQQPQVNQQQQQPQMNQQQQPQMNQQQQPQINQQQPQMNQQQQPQMNQQQMNQQPLINQQSQVNQQQPQMNQQQFQMNQQPQMNQQQFQMNQQGYHQGNMGGPPMQPFQPSPYGNQFQPPIDGYPGPQIPSSPSGSNERYLVGNLSEPYSFQVVPPSVKVNYIGLNGHVLFILGMGFSNKSKFTYDEQNNRLTILSLDPTTVGYYAAVDGNWREYTTILSAINGKLIDSRKVNEIYFSLFSFFSSNS